MSAFGVVLSTRKYPLSLRDDEIGALWGSLSPDESSILFEGCADYLRCHSSSTEGISPSLPDLSELCRGGLCFTFNPEPFYSRCFNGTRFCLLTKRFRVCSDGAPALTSCFIFQKEAAHLLSPGGPAQSCHVVPGREMSALSNNLLTIRLSPRNSCRPTAFH